VSELKRLIEGFKIMARSISALMLREILTRYGRKGLGFLWLFLEPILFVGAFTLVRFFTMGRGEEKDIHFIVTFMLTGIVPTVMWRNAVNRTMDALLANVALLYHRYITITDIFLARIVVEIVAVTGVFIFLSVVLVFADLMYKPYDLFYTVIGWLLQAWYAFGLALTVGSLASKFESVRRIWPPIGLILFITGGTFYMVEWLPPELREYAMLIPTVNNIELIRYGFFGPEMTPYYDVAYSASFNLFLTLIGLILLKYVSLTFEPD